MKDSRLAWIWPPAAGPEGFPDYAVLGRVTDGLDVVEKIGKLGDANDPNGTPPERVEIKSMQLETR